MSLSLLLAIFAAAGGVILVAGLSMTRLADQIADRTGFGEALVGGVLLGAATSLSGSVVSLTTALNGDASMAFANGVGGIAAQTAFLALADAVYRRANLEHAAAEVANLFQGTTLFLLLTIPLVAFTLPEFTIWGVHPASVALLLIYVAGVKMADKVRERPMWKAVHTRETRKDEPENDDEPSQSARGPLIRFLTLMVFLGLAGWVIAGVAEALAQRLGLSSTFVGALMTAVITSMPELVTTIAAVRRGALQLAVGGIIGGNTFDTLFITISDAAYRDGSLYHALTPGDFFWLATGLLMTAILLSGLLYRQQSGPGRIGWESTSMLVVYAGAVAMQALVL